MFPPLSTRELHVWRVDLDRSPSEILRQSLAAEERQRSKRLVREADRRRFIASHAALRAILAQYLGISPGQVEMAAPPGGKPALTPRHDGPPLHFNLSHSERLALVAVSLDREIGVDVERVRPCVDVENIVERYFAPGERTAWRALPEGERLAAFFRGWTRKEAYLKARGLGLSAGLDRFEVSLAPDEPARLLRSEDPTDSLARWEIYDVSPGDGFMAACVAERGVETVSVFDWPLPPLTPPGPEPGP